MKSGDVHSPGRGVFRLPGWRLAGVALVLLFVMGPAAQALDITTADGKTYHQVEIEKVEPDGLRIMHADGAARIPYEKLPEALQKKYFDPEKIAAYRQQFAQQQQEAAVKAAAAERLREAAAAQAAEAERERLAELQRQADLQRAAAQTQEGLRLAAQRHKAQIATGLLVLAGALAFFLYFLPTIIARRKANALAIFVFNLFFGWSGIGWIAALIWACTKDSAMDTLAQHHLNQLNSQQPPPPPPPPAGRYLGNQLPNPAPKQIRGRELSEGDRYLP